MSRPHVVILGAGASRAAFPDGDRNGHSAPLMADLVDVVGLAPILAKHGLGPAGGDFEDTYARIAESPGTATAQSEIQERIHNYFSSLALPDSVTLYDYLVLSLRKKDLIATFNWDPFLWQAWTREYESANLPHLAFLHGSVAIGYCASHRKFGPSNALCGTCGEPLQQVPLLYPVPTKGYSSSPFIEKSWRVLQGALRDAYALTIFGYAAPASDADAVALMKQAWGNPQLWEYEQTEVIDIKPRADIEQTWRPFICEHHYDIRGSFFDSWLWNHPRRSCEAMWDRFMECACPQAQPPPCTQNLEELRRWVKTLTRAEPAGA